MKLTRFSGVSDSCGHGIVIDPDSAVVVTGGTQVINNHGFGILGLRSVRLDLRSFATIERNDWGGVLLGFISIARLEGNVVIQINGQNPDPSNPLSSFAAGIAIRGASTLQRSPTSFADAPTIQFNSGPGILADLNSTVAVDDSLTLQENTGGGLNLEHNSVADLAVPGIVMTVNGSGSIKDLNCDASSEAFGDFTGVSSSTCLGH